MGLMEGIAIGVVGSLIAAEIYCLLPRISRWVVTKATRKLPADLRDRYSEEWQAYLNEWDGNIGKFCSALGFVWSGQQLLAQWHAERGGLQRRYIKSAYSIAISVRHVLYLARKFPSYGSAYARFLNAYGIIHLASADERKLLVQDFFRDVAAPPGCSGAEKRVARALRIARIVRRAVRRW